MTYTELEIYDMATSLGISVNEFHYLNGILGLTMGLVFALFLSKCLKY